MKRTVLAFLFAFTLLSLSVSLGFIAGCAQVGMQAPRDFNDELGYSYAAVTSARLAAANALDTGQIKLADAQRVLILSDQARALLDSARAAHGVKDDTSAAALLAQTTAILVQLQAITGGK